MYGLEPGTARRNTLLTHATARIVLSALVVLASFAFAGAGPAAADTTAAQGVTAPPAGYVADFVATAATGIAMNDAGWVTGTSYPDAGCGPFCLPTEETVVWRGTKRIVLPSIPGLTGIYVRAINAKGWVAGFAGVPGTTTHAVVWKPNSNTYQAIDLGTLPGTTISDATGIDDLGRVVGWSTTQYYPPNGSPFMWTESGGMVDLSALGFPDEAPQAISPGGTVATAGYWYRLGDPNSIVAMPAPPQGFYPPGTGAVINDAGDQARFLVSTGGGYLDYLFRFHHNGTWQLLSNTGSGNLAPHGIGSINAVGDVTATIVGTAMIAYGPDGLAQPLAALLSPAYQGSEITIGGPMNNSGQILAKVMVGRSQRVMRLIPAQACTTGCIRVGSLLVRAKFVQDPQNPGQCYQGGNAYNVARVNLTVTDEAGARLSDVLVRGRFLDDYWTNAPVARMTNSQGAVTFNYRGQCGVGAIAFLVDSAVKAPLVFDRTVGIVTGWAVPQ
jgi:probable HAF family extracellular repeat protein